MSPAALRKARVAVLRVAVALVLVSVALVSAARNGGADGLQQSYRSQDLLVLDTGAPLQLSGAVVQLSDPVVLLRDPVVSLGGASCRLADTQWPRENALRGDGRRKSGCRLQRWSVAWPASVKLARRLHCRSRGGEKPPRPTSRRWGERKARGDG